MAVAVAVALTSCPTFQVKRKVFVVADYFATHEEVKSSEETMVERFPYRRSMMNSKG